MPGSDKEKYEANSARLHGGPNVAVQGIDAVAWRSKCCGTGDRCNQLSMVGLADRNQFLVVLRYQVPSCQHIR